MFERNQGPSRQPAQQPAQQKPTPQLTRHLTPANPLSGAVQTVRLRRTQAAQKQVRPDPKAGQEANLDPSAAGAPRSNAEAFVAGYPREITVDSTVYEIGDEACPYFYRKNGEGYEVVRKRGQADDGIPQIRIKQNDDGDFVVTSVDGKRLPIERFGDSATEEDALGRLTRDGSSFKAYLEMLEGHRLATRENVLEAMANPAGATVDNIRHKLKHEFRDNVLNSTYSAGGHEFDMHESQRRLVEITRDLNSSDQGSLTEAWVRHWHLPPGTANQIDIPLLPDMKGPRKYDFLEIQDGVATEVKSIGGQLSRHDTDQFQDYMTSIRNQHKIGGIPVRELVYVFTNADGAKVNAKWIRQMMEEYPVELTVHVHDAYGHPHSFKQEDGKEELDAFFGRMT